MKPSHLEAPRNPRNSRNSKITPRTHPPLYRHSVCDFAPRRISFDELSKGCRDRGRGLAHETHDQLEVFAQRCERLILHAVDRFGERPIEEARVLAEVEASDEIGGVLAARAAFGRVLEPESRARDSVDEHLHGLRFVGDGVIAHDEHTRDVIRPVFARVKENAAEAGHLRLRRIRLAHGNASIAFAARAPATSGGAISTIRTSLAFIPFCASALKTIRRSSEKRLGMAMTFPFRSANDFTGPSFCTTTALP